MIRATICIPEQRLQRMRGKAMTSTNDNPYAAPTLEPLQKAAKKHHEFQVTDKGILCRKGLELPKICLVTGRTDNLVVRRVGFIWTPLSAMVIMFGSTLFIFIGTIGTTFLKIYFSESPNEILKRIISTNWLLIAWIIAGQVPMLLGVFLSPRGSLTAFIHISVQQRIRRYKVNAVAAGVLVSVIAFGAILIVWSDDLVSLIAAILGLIAGGFVWVRQKKTGNIFQGLKLKVIGYHAGQFEVAGFKPEFIETLRTFRDGQHRPS